MENVFILGIESSCDETSAAVICNEIVLSNVIANQNIIHQFYGGVVPELASRAHQQKIIPVVEEALRLANITKNELNAISFTRGPGLMGALLVGVSFAKSLSMALNIPLIEVNHMQGHILAHFLQQKNIQKNVPTYPFLCLTVSGGHTQIVQVDSVLEMKILGMTQDDAAGEAFDKTAKIIGLPYPGGPLVDKYAQLGNPDRFKFPHPQVNGLNFSFSGLKTAILYFIRDQQKTEIDFVQKNLNDICASVQKTIVEILIDKLRMAIKQTGITQIAIAGGVSANSGLRKAVNELEKEGCKTFIPAFEFCTDNAAMIAMTGYYKFLNKEFSTLDVTPLARY